MQLAFSGNRDRTRESAVEDRKRNEDGPPARIPGQCGQPVFRGRECQVLEADTEDVGIKKTGPAARENSSAVRRMEAERQN